MIEHSGASEQGPARHDHQDFIAHRCPEETELRCAKGSLFVVADGVGGGLAGDVASREAAETLIREYYDLAKVWGKALQDAVQKANLRVYDLGHDRDKPQYHKMQTTLSAIALVNDQAIVAHVGDSRIYRIRNGDIQQVTRDHSEVSELVKMGIITPEEARHHPRRNIITRAIGSEMFVQAEYHNLEVEQGDQFVLCTDGMWEPVEEQDIAAAVTAHSPAEACRILIDLAIERKTKDNLSIQIVKVVEWEGKTGGAPRQKQGLFQRLLRPFGKNQKGA